MERVTSRVILVLLLGFFPRGCWGITIDLDTCIQFQLNTVLVTCSAAYSSEDSLELWRECMLDEGVDACMQCVKSNILDEFLEDTSFYTFDSQGKVYKFLEFLVTEAVQALTDCVQLKDDSYECFGTVFAERLMTSIRLFISENFLHPEFVRCWAERTVNDAIRCFDVPFVQPAVRFGTAANIQDQGENGSSPDMSLPGSSSKHDDNQQALNKDYEFSGFDRGQLNPTSFQHEEMRYATFTLTNAVPLDPCFHRIHWNKWEKETKMLLYSVSDEGSAYIVTGAVPTEYRIPRKSEFDGATDREYHRVSIPSHIWTAVCYKHNSDNSKSFSFGYIGTNEERSTIKAMSITSLREKLNELYGNSRSVTIFEGDCDSSSLLSQKTLETYSKGELNRIDRFYMPQNLKMIYDAASGSHGVSHDESQTSQGNYPYITKLEIIDQPQNIITWFTKTEELKKETKTVCVLKSGFAHLVSKKQVNASESQNKLTCIMLPEKSVEGSVITADGTRCVKGETCSSHKCLTNNGEKECCSTPCLYDHEKFAYMCKSGTKEISCSPQYSAITSKGEKCRDDHFCATYGKTYYWCYTESSWDYCSPPHLLSNYQSREQCHSNHHCGMHGYSYYWCYIDDNYNWKYCCLTDDHYSAYNGKACLPTHPCDYYNKKYLWCYTTDGRWDYCCNQRPSA